MDDPSPSSDTTANHSPPTSAASLQPTNPKFSNGPHIRSRITVVCAECKRLKLKCDRRTPCGSCVKRDTVHRCQYSAAAAEKIDVQSLHNRLQIVESQIAQIAAAGVRGPAPLSATADSLPFPHSDRAMLASDASGSSVTISLDDVAALWLEHLDLPQAYPAESTPAGSALASPAAVKIEPTVAELPPHDEPPLPALLPPLSVYFHHSSHSPMVTPQLVALLPSASTTRSRIMGALEETMRMHPCFNMKQFKSRVESMFAWAKEEDGKATSGAGSSNPNPKADLARSIFFGSTAPSTSPSRSPPTLTFFASVAAAFALGVLICKENEAASEAEQARSGASKAARMDESASSSQRPSPWHKCSSTGLHALSVQALATNEFSNMYDVDFLIASIMQILFLLHDGKPRVAHTVYPLVGKMVNIAHMMGLSTDPDEFQGRYGLFEAEMRRRVWWDVYYYDVFVADCMGQAPTIQDNSYTTKMPADVDEDQFCPASTSLPVPVPRGAGGDPGEVGFAYFTQKCRLAQLVKSVKKRSFKDPLTEDAEPDLLLENAEQFEAEVKRWLSDLPRAFRMDIASESSPAAPSTTSSTAPSLQAQRCELAIVANRVILKVFLPFLKTCADPSSDILPRRVVSSIIDSAHAIIHAVRVLHSVWRYTRPASFAFYSFGRTLFDAAVMAANAVILHPTGASASVALSDISTALDIMKETRCSTTGRGRARGTPAPSSSEAVRIVETLRAKAERVRAGNGGPYHAGTKRKHAEIDPGRLEGGFLLPYVGAGVTCSRPAPDAAPRAGRPPPHRDASEAREDSSAPQIPTRGRPRQNSAARRRASGSSGGGGGGGGGGSAMPAPLHIPSHAGTPAPPPSPFELQQQAGSAMEFGVPYARYAMQDPSHAQAQTHSTPPLGMYDSPPQYGAPELVPRGGGGGGGGAMQMYGGPPAHPPPAFPPPPAPAPFGTEEYFAPAEFEGHARAPADAPAYMMKAPAPPPPAQQQQQRLGMSLATSISQAQAQVQEWPPPPPGEMQWGGYPKYY